MPISTWQKNLRLYDKLTLTVLVLLPLLALLAGKQDATTLRCAVLHAFAFVAVLILIRTEARQPAWARFLRDWYPIILLTFFFGEVGRIVNLLLPFWLEPHLIQSDYIVFGQHAFEYLAPRLTPATTEIFAFAYWAYYPLIPFVVGLFYFSRRRTAGALQPTFEQVMNRICASLYLCYVCFLLFPARGPHHALNVSIAELTSGGFFFNFVLAVQKRGAVVGAAFPSSHVAAAWTMLLALRRSFRTTFWLLLPLVLLLSISTFVLQYHYWVDALAGIILAFVLEKIMTWRENRLHDGTPHGDKKILTVQRREAHTVTHAQTR
ncbi:phosphatase PAP2 family protein [candidate division KSB1 bacterium]|nr:phosphatase PAP2 family protein [candidate division KSB1 bacterium]